MVRPGHYLTTAEAARRAGITSRRVRALAAAGAIPGAWQPHPRMWLVPSGWVYRPGKRGRPAAPGS